MEQYPTWFVCTEGNTSRRNTLIIAIPSVMQVWRQRDAKLIPTSSSRF